MIFVFGSNLAGRHGAGAALHAAIHHGAVHGLGEGPQGTSYAIPTKDKQVKTLPLADIKLCVTRFLHYAAARREIRFKVTRIGCGLAGYRDEQIAPMFAGAPDNVEFFDERWKNWTK